MPGFGSPILTLDDVRLVAAGVVLLALLLLVVGAWALRRRR